MSCQPSASLTRLIVIGALFGLWEISARLFTDPMFVSPPSEVLASLGGLLRTPGVLYALLLTLGELLVAFLLALALGLSLGMLIGTSRLSRRAAMPIVLLLYATPQITILPVIMLAVGIGPTSKIVFGATHGRFPIIVTVVASLQNVPPVLSAAARSMGASRWRRIRYLLLPYMLPGFLTGVRLAMSATLLGVLLAELVASSRGIGHFTRLFTESFQPAYLFGLIGIVAFAAAFVNELLRQVEIKFSRWRRES